MPAASHGPLCGREEELARLLAGWNAVVAGDGPRVEVILGEPGMGKTRLVQEFYAAIAAQQAPAGERGYWPARLGREGANLSLNARLGDVAGEASPSFLWWAIRLANPFERNTVATGAVAGYRSALTPHLDALRQGRKMQMIRVRMALSSAKLIADFSPVGPLVDIVGGVTNIAKEYRALGRERDTSLSELDQRDRDDLNASILKQLEEVVRARGDGATIPIVWVIDDAQFGPHDPGAVDLFETLLHTAMEQGWPLLIVVTHWVREWNLHEREPLGRTIAAALERVYLPHERGWAPIALRAVAASALKPMLQAGLPGLTAAQTATLLERVGGQPGLLDEVIHLCRDRPGFFEGGDPHGAFKDAAFRRVLELPRKLQDLAGERLRHLPPEIAALASFASVQGVRFAPEFHRALADRLGLGGPHVAALLDERNHRAALHPHAVFLALEGGGAAFAQRALYEAARERWSDHFDLDRDHVDAAWRTLLEEVVRAPRGDAAGAFVDELAASALAGSPEPRERLEGAWALGRLAATALRERDVHTAAALAAEVWRGTQDGKWRAADLGVATLTTLFDALRKSEHAGWAIAVAEALWACADGARARCEALGKLGDACQDVGDRERAVALHREAFALVEAEAARAPEGAWARELGWAHHRLALHAHARRAHGEAIAHFEAALAALRVRQAHDDGPRAQQDVARVLTLLARERQSAGDEVEALAVAEEALRANHALAAAWPTAAHDRGLSIALGKVGDIRLGRGETERALAAYREADEIAQRLHLTSPTPEHERGVAISLGRLGDALLQHGDAGQALRHFEASRAISVGLAAALRTDPYREGPGFAFDRLGRAYRALGRVGDALDAFAQAAAVWSALLAPSPVAKYRTFALASVRAGLAAHAALPERDRPAAVETHARLLALQRELGGAGDG